MGDGKVGCWAVRKVAGMGSLMVRKRADGLGNWRAVHSGILKGDWRVA